jgi:hypothetical protein
LKVERGDKMKISSSALATLVILGTALGGSAIAVNARSGQTDVGSSSITQKLANPEQIMVTPITPDAPIGTIENVTPIPTPTAPVVTPTPVVTPSEPPVVPPVVVPVTPPNYGGSGDDEDSDDDDSYSDDGDDDSSYGNSNYEDDEDDEDGEYDD